DRTSRFPTASISLTRVRKFESNFIADCESNIILLNEDWQSGDMTPCLLLIFQTLANLTVLAFPKFLISRKSKENAALPRTVYDYFLPRTRKSYYSSYRV
ncbi:hypothetical protein L249_3768, partial [Ophiocordyceps polyrhachis-furcata BCC 54312]